MTTLYLTRPQTTLTADRTTFTLHYHHLITGRYPISQIQQIICFEGTHLDRRSQREIQRQQIPLLQLDRTGTICGRWNPPIAPLNRHASPSSHLDLGQWLAQYHLKEAIDLLSNLQGTPALAATRRVLALLHDSLNDAETLDRVRGYYATATAYYDRALRESLIAYLLQLNGSRPLMSLSQLLRVGESLLHHHLELALSRADLDLNLGYLHSPTDCDAPLVCDAVAVLRPAFVDGFVWRWLHRCGGGSRTWLGFCSAWDCQPLLGDRLEELVHSLSRWSDRTT
jgi:CRISPR/Cas system-associated endonuclease Cas1